MKVYAIPHTGTNFTHRLITWQMGISVEGVHNLFVADTPAWVRRGGKAVVPIRDPMLAAISSLNRGEGPNMALWEEVAKWA